MAAFGVPIPSTGVEAFERDARDAVAAGLAMGKTVTKLNRVWGDRGYPTIGIRVGICSGEIVTGSIGSSQRLKFSIVGDVVVTAQRLESLDDSKHDFDAEVVRILVHPQTREYLGDSFAICEFGEHVLKGRVEPVLVHKILTKQVTPASVDAPR